MAIDDKPRCAWPTDDHIMLRYHDEEWGAPVHDDCKWFEFILLDAFQAGLSWKTVLHKRAGFRQVFHDFDPERVARMSDKAMENARQNPAIIRNRLKIQAAAKNARAFPRFRHTMVPLTASSGHLLRARSFITRGRHHRKSPLVHPCQTR